ncbi:hypothetical protein BFP77_01845 [Maribacter sp. 4U21]|nr:hypothetical protein BFP77_01845 [Maribacter sp. 4U21]
MTSKGNKFVNRILGVFFLLWAIDILDGALMINGFYFNYPNLALWTESFLFLYGPLIYFYTLYTLDESRNNKLKDLIHFLPFIVVFIVFLRIYHFNPLDFKLEILKEINSLNQPIESLPIYVLVYAHFFFYLFCSYRKVKQEIRNLKEFYSQPVLQWLRSLLTTVALVLILALASSFFQFLGLQLYFNISIFIILLIIGLLMGRLIFKTLEEKSPIYTALTDRKYSGSNLQDCEATQIKAKIIATLKNEELYLNPELTLKQLSEKLGVSSKKVSQVINERIGKSFFDLINTFRIEHAKRIFKENKDSKLTVLEVLYAVGFNSKSSFNTEFKKRTGLTPSEFQKIQS